MVDAMLGRSIASVVSAIISAIFLLCAGVLVLIYAPNSPLPEAWNPTKPLSISAPVNLITNWKLSRALANGKDCKAALNTGAQFQILPDKIDSQQCGIVDQIQLTNIGSAKIKPVNTRCQTALRLAMWAEQDLQPIAQRLFGHPITEIRHFSSYNCRQMRTSSGSQSRMSSHATAEAIDISGFVLANGTRIDLKTDWTGSIPKASFLQRANITACKWFRLSLGPDYNALHADHFHLQHTGWGFCR